MRSAKSLASGDAQSQGGGGKKRRIALVGLAAMIVLAGGWYLFSLGKVSTDDAFVDGKVHSVTPRVSGYVTNVPVEDNQEVEPGQILVELDPTDYEVALAQAKADLAVAESTLAGLKLGVPLELNQTTSKVGSATAQLESLYKSLEQTKKEHEAAKQIAAQAQAEYDKTQLDLKRYTDLLKKTVVAQADFDTAQTHSRTAFAAMLAARAKADALLQNLASLESGIARLKAEISLAQTGEDVAEIKAKDAQAQAARVELARQRVNQAELNLGYTKIKAPVRGVITKKRVEPGQLVAAGQPLLAVVPLEPGELWVTANYKETQLTNVRPGQNVVFEVDAYPGRKLSGVVDSIMAGSGAVFSLFPPENATGNYVKVVQRIPVKIRLSQDNKDLPPMRLGMSVVPTIYTK